MPEAERTMQDRFFTSLLRENADLKERLEWQARDAVKLQTALDGMRAQQGALSTQVSQQFVTINDWRQRAERAEAALATEIRRRLGRKGSVASQPTPSQAAPHEPPQEGGWVMDDATFWRARDFIGKLASQKPTRQGEALYWMQTDEGIASLLALLDLRAALAASEASQRALREALSDDVLPRVRALIEAQCSRGWHGLEHPLKLLLEAVLPLATAAPPAADDEAAP